jgi:hypothetical protein
LWIWFCLPAFHPCKDYDILTLLLWRVGFEVFYIQRTAHGVRRG